MLDSKDFLKFYQSYCPSSLTQGEILTKVGTSLSRPADKVYERKGLRLSALGNANLFIEIAFKLGLLQREVISIISEKQKLLFSIGHFYESWLQHLFEVYGFKVTTEVDVLWNGITGHADMIIENERGNQILIECKTASSDNFKRYKKEGMNDHFGYLTQLCTYQDFFGIPAYWFVFNKDDCDLAIIPLHNIDFDFRTIKLKQAKERIEVYNECGTEEELYKWVVPPVPSIEQKVDGTPVLDNEGNYKLYPKWGTEHIEFQYLTKLGRTGYGKDRTYIIDFNYPTPYQHYKPDILKLTLDYHGVF